MVRQGDRREVRGEPVVRPVSMARRAPAMSRATSVMRWARTGTDVTRQEWLEDSLAGLLWYVGVFVVLGILVQVVRFLAG